MENNSTNNTPDTPESIWAILRKVSEMQEENARQLKVSSAEFDRRIQKLEETTGGISANHGYFAEEYFFNSFEKGNRNFFGEKFDRITKNAKPFDFVIEDEYDIVFVNCEAVGIIEVKFKAHENNIPQVLKKAKTFRANFPKYANHRIYLGLASMAFYPEVELECKKAGIAIVKQVGETVVISDEHLKVF